MAATSTRFHRLSPIKGAAAATEAAWEKMDGMG
jgi:hypothetical protein